MVPQIIISLFRRSSRFQTLISLENVAVQWYIIAIALDQTLNLKPVQSCVAVGNTGSVLSLVVNLYHTLPQTVSIGIYG